MNSPHSYAVRPSIGGRPVLTTTVDRDTRMLTFATEDGNQLTVDLTTARAIWMTIQEAVYQERSVPADGPGLTMEIDRGTGSRIETVRGS